MTIEWPEEWASEEAWAEPAANPPLTEEGRTWAGMDENLKKQGGSLAEVLATLGCRK